MGSNLVRMAIVLGVIMLATDVVFAEYVEKWSYDASVVGDRHNYDHIKRPVDVNGDSYSDILLGGLEVFVALSGYDGSLLWSVDVTESGGWFFCGIGELDGDQYREILLTHDSTSEYDTLVVLDGLGGLREWSLQTAVDYVVLIDVDNDGLDEIMFRSGDYIRCYEWDIEPGVGDDEVQHQSLPKDLAVSQNYPNPFNPSTTIEYNIPKHSQVTVTIYNVAGQLVDVPINEMQAAGNHRFVWNGYNRQAEKVASGVYFYSVKAGDLVQSKKMLLVK